MSTDHGHMSFADSVKAIADRRDQATVASREDSIEAAIASRRSPYAPAAPGATAQTHAEQAADAARKPEPDPRTVTDPNAVEQALAARRANRAR